ncbi:MULTISPECIES: 16S rRNA (uracil(1498)-N(3))-methyltransferase [Caldimonas]|jgi:16S rRNA (uracil1498-N3)-methyltransferase|uniref:16S rRNA (uracil(1498)-N(3))-methyltransferase n=1 Tax=Caldimonas TaxID=196013 RepID=UPI00035F8A67|nr:MULTISPECIES: 16S rRNA (uracil(1498)-N(3))-methyltransferase [Caldimonas]MCX7660199.1 16S rRNA (uracil(1498)-N(3))-methyltransferase [Caldimonas manganoxidans]GIX26023.1 MAG: ribosomal RNA small subunit methyltransferase E [Caldimonas sp.]
MPRVHVDLALACGQQLTLPPGPSRHVQVLRLQAGDGLVLFNGQGGEWVATITRMGRQAVDVRIDRHLDIERELPRRITLAVGMPANERMDTLVEKATELGAAALLPLVCERSVLRPTGERAQKKQAHWQAVAVAACEQSGRNRVPMVEPVRGLREALGRLEAGMQRWVLSLREEATPLPLALRELPAQAPLVLLSGPEGGLSPAEEDLARAHGFRPVNLGPRVLRAETAPLAALAALAMV